MHHAVEVKRKLVVELAGGVLRNLMGGALGAAEKKHT